MKKVLALILMLVLCFSVCACDSNNSDTNDKDEQQNEEEVNKGSEENEEYEQIIDWLKNNEFDNAISLIQQMKEDAAKAENASKGIKEIAITIDNWSEYFEFAYDYDYYRNSFGEITHINCSSGFKLKDGYELVVDDVNLSLSKVAFEAVQESYAAEVTYNFAEGTFTVVDVDDNDEDNYTKTNTTTYSENVCKAFGENPATGVAGMGSMWQGSADDGEVQNENVTRIIEVLRAEGTIYIYEN